ncbi:MAG: DUF1631 domain-containing protein [Gammaproteobacteria bacterium]
MNDHHAKNVITMSHFAPKLDGRPRELMRKVEDAAGRQLKQLVRGMLDKADDALFDLANRADSNAAQQLYFDAMRDIRLKRGSIEHGMAENTRRFFDDFAAGQPLAREWSADDEALDADGLALVEVDDMEELIAIRNMVAKAERASHHELYDLTVRLAEVTKRRDLKEDQHPLSPSAIVHAFGDTVQPLDLDMQVKLIIYKLFDKYVMSGVQALHKELNAVLVKEGVLPKIRRSVKNNGGTGYRRPAPRQAFDDQMPLGEDDPNGVVPHVGGAYGGAYGGGLMAGGSPVVFGGMPITDASLLGALSSMQGYVVENGYPDGMSPEEIGVQVLNVSRAVRGGRVDGADEKTISMVSMIFDYILEDRSVPDAVKALIARLQIPVLKVALLDREFFSHKKHPARRLLNEMARASIGWAEDKSRDGDSLVEVIGSIVDRVLGDFEDDPDIFAELLEQFESYLEAEEERVRVFEERTRKTTEGKERVEFAKQRTEAWIEMWTSRDNLPDFIVDFLRTTWKNTLLITMHRYGEDSRQWAGHIKTVNNLLWSITPKKTAKGGRLLVEMIPGIVADVRKGMELASVHPETIRRFFTDLAKLHAKTVNGGIERDFDDLPAVSTGSGDGQPAGDEHIPTLFDVPAIDEVLASSTRSGDPDFDQADDVEQLILNVQTQLAREHDGAPATQGSGADEQAMHLRSDVEGLLGDADEIEEIVLQAPGASVTDRSETTHQDEFTALAEGLEVGGWVQFTDEHDNTVRAKLSWKSPLTSCCLFVNRKGLKVAEKSVAGFAAELRAGRARILDQVPVLDRAINALMDKGAEQGEGGGIPEPA